MTTEPDSRKDTKEDLEYQEFKAMQLRNQDYFEVFDGIFKEKLKEYMIREKERVKHEGQDGAEIEKKMFQFSKQRVKEIEHQVRELYFHDKKLENPSCTKLNNVSA